MCHRAVEETDIVQLVCIYFAIDRKSEQNSRKIEENPHSAQANPETVVKVESTKLVQCEQSQRVKLEVLSEARPVYDVEG